MDTAVPDTGKRAKRIMVVEDERNMRELLADFLSGEGFEVYAASNGEEALDLLRKVKDVDLMLLDILMPGINGRKLLGYLRHSGLRKFPIIVLSALRDQEQIFDTYVDGTDHYMTKPFELDELLNAIEYYLGTTVEPA